MCAPSHSPIRSANDKYLFKERTVQGFVNYFFLNLDKYVIIPLSTWGKYVAVLACLNVKLKQSYNCCMSVHSVAKTDMYDLSTIEYIFFSFFFIYIESNFVHFVQVRFISVFGHSGFIFQIENQFYYIFLQPVYCLFEFAFSFRSRNSCLFNSANHRLVSDDTIFLVCDLKYLIAVEQAVVII